MSPHGAAPGAQLCASATLKSPPRNKAGAPGNKRGLGWKAQGKGHQQREGDGEKGTPGIEPPVYQPGSRITLATVFSSR